MKRKRSTREILRIKFEVLLNEYDAYNAWKRNVMDTDVNFHIEVGSIFKRKWTSVRDFFTVASYGYWVNSFRYHSANQKYGENYDWYIIASEWSERLEAFRKNENTN